MHVDHPWPLQFSKTSHNVKFYLKVRLQYLTFVAGLSINPNNDGLAKLVTDVWIKQLFHNTLAIQLCQLAANLF